MHINPAFLHLNDHVAAMGDLKNSKRRREGIHTARD